MIQRKRFLFSPLTQPTAEQIAQGRREEILSLIFLLFSEGKNEENSPKGSFLAIGIDTRYENASDEARMS